MLYQKVYLEKDRSMADSGEYTVDITPRDPITVMYVKFQAVNGGTSNRNNPLAGCINSVEIIDGADVLFSLDGQEAFALAAYHMGRLPSAIVDEDAGQSQTVSLPIFFGRYIGDTDLAFDPTKFRNPQVRVNWNLANVTAVGATGYLTGRMELSIIAEVMSGAPSPVGVLSAKERYTYTTTAGGTEYIEMPTDEVWRKLLLRGVKVNNPWHWIYDVVKLSCDGGKFIPLDMRGWDMLNQLNLTHSRFNYQMKGRALGNDAVTLNLMHDEVMSPVSDGTGDAVYEVVYNGGGGCTLSIYTAGVLTVANQNYYAPVSGYLPFKVLSVPFGKQIEIGDWFPAPAFGSIRLEIRGGVAASSNYIALQTVRTY